MYVIYLNIIYIYYYLLYIIIFVTHWKFAYLSMYFPCVFSSLSATTTAIKKQQQQQQRGESINQLDQCRHDQMLLRVSLCFASPISISFPSLAISLTRAKVHKNQK